MFEFLMAQKIEPRKKYWYSEIQEIIEEFKLEMTEEEIINTNSTRYLKKNRERESYHGRNKIPQNQTNER